MALIDTIQQHLGPTEIQTIGRQLGVDPQLTRLASARRSAR